MSLCLPLLQARLLKQRLLDQRRADDAMRVNVPVRYEGHSGKLTNAAMRVELGELERRQRLAPDVATDATAQVRADMRWLSDAFERCKAAEP